MIFHALRSSRLTGIRYLHIREKGVLKSFFLSADNVVVTGPNCNSRPSCYTWDRDSSQHVVYGCIDGHVRELWITNADRRWHNYDLTLRSKMANYTFCDPIGYTYDVDKGEHVVYIGKDQHIHEFSYCLDGTWHHSDLTSADETPSFRRLACYTCDVGRTQYVIYTGEDGHIHELVLVSE